MSMHAMSKKARMMHINGPCGMCDDMASLVMARCTVIDPNAMTFISMQYIDPKENSMDPNVCRYGHI
jgi:hypothetical protein